jgi:hypothetical protein
MIDPVENLMLDLVKFVARQKRNSCPKLPVGKEAIDRGLVATTQTKWPCSDSQNAPCCYDHSGSHRAGDAAESRLSLERLFCC